MQIIEVISDGDGAWPDLEDARKAGLLTHLTDREHNWHIAVAALPRGMESGRTSLAIRIDKPDGEVILVETSLLAWATAITSLQMRHPV